MLEEDLLYGQAVDAGDVTQEALGATHSLVMAVGHDVPVLENVLFDVVRALEDEIQKVQSESDATTRQISQKDGNIRQLDLKVRLLTDDSVPVVDLKKQLAAGDTRIGAVEGSSVNLNKSLASITRSLGASRLKLGSPYPDINRGEGVI